MLTRRQLIASGIAAAAAMQLPCAEPDHAQRLIDLLSEPKVSPDIWETIDAIAVKRASGPFSLKLSPKMVDHEAPKFRLRHRLMLVDGDNQIIMWSHHPPETDEERASTRRLVRNVDVLIGPFPELVKCLGIR